VALTMGTPFFTKLVFIAASSLLGISFAYSQAKDDLVMVLDGQHYSIAYYKSSIKSLPPDWKKVWIITNRKLNEGQAQLRVVSVRRNILFNCVRNTYSTLATINYAEPNAAGKPMLQTDTGFNLNDDPVPEGSPLAIVQSQVCMS
jgi:hypothetical protein